MNSWKWLDRTLVFLLCLMLLTQSVYTPQTTLDKVRQYTGSLEFDYFTWETNSLILKLGISGLHIEDRVSAPMQHDFVVKYFDLVKNEENLAGQISLIYANPAVSNPKTQAATLLDQQQQLQALLDEMAPVVEDILQSQVSQVLADSGLSLGGQTMPSLLFHTTPLPKALIVSPRDVIRQDVNISLLADLPLDQITHLEDTISKALNVSVLIEDIGGVGVYPTMVMQSSSPTWVIQTIAHEWTHNYLSLHPLGLNYDTTPELRTMNETTADIVGTEIGAIVVDRFYPEWKNASIPSTRNHYGLADNSVPDDTFDFNHEMHVTRVQVDELLKEGKIDEAENYMEQRRQVFVEHGYLIRKLNQAYFAFHGAYAETAQGAAGTDPVGPAVRELRAKSSTLADFVNKIAWMSSFSDLQKTAGSNQ
jgi:hypothetical protein